MKRTFLLRSVFLLLTGMLASIPVCAEEDSAFANLTSAASTPNVNESEIISIFSDHFQTQKGVSINAAFGRKIATTKFGSTDNFVYVDTQSGGQLNGIVFNEAIDATNYDIIHVDLFCVTGGTNGLRTRITLGDADGGGGSTANAYKTTLGTAKVGEWTTYEVRISDLVKQISNSTNVKKIKSIWFFDSEGGKRSYFVDNIYFKKTGDAPTGGGGDGDNTEKLGEDVAFESLTSLAPAPTGVDADNIINVFSDHFANPIGLTVGNNSASQPVGRLLKSTSGDNLFFVDNQSGGTKTGIVFNQAIDATNYDKICLDLYATNGGDNGMRPRITLADADGKGGSTPGTEDAAKTIGYAKQGEWKHYELSVSEISSKIAEANRPDLTKLKSIWFFDYGGQKRSYFVDNVYFVKSNSSGGDGTKEDAAVESLTAAAPTPKDAQADVVNYFSDHYTGAKGVSIASDVEGRIITTSKFGSTDNIIYTENNSGGEKAGIVFNEAFDANVYDIIHVDIYTVGAANGLRPRIKLTDSDGTGCATKVEYSEILGTAPMGSWQSYDLSVKDILRNAASTTLPDKSKIKSIWFFDTYGARTLFIDNIYVKKAPNDDAAIAAIVENLTEEAPTPTEAAENVINVFSDHYPNPMGVDLGSNVQGKVFATDKFGETDNFAYIDNMKGGNTRGIVFNGTVDATEYDILHVDLYAVNPGANGLRPRFTLADEDGSGGTTPQDYASTIGITKGGEWISYDISISDVLKQLTGTKPNKRKLKSIWFFDYGGGERTYFVDNIYFKKTGVVDSGDDVGGETEDVNAPTTPAPTPKHQQEDVLSLFSSHYEQAATIILDNPGSPTCKMEVLEVGENKYLRFMTMNWCLTKINPVVNLDDYDYIHMDIYALSDPKLVFGFGNGGDKEGRTPWQYLQKGWKSIDIPTALLKENGADLKNLSVWRMFSATGFAIDRLYFDNIYAYKGSPSGDVITYEIAQSPEPIMPKKCVKSILTDKYGEELTVAPDAVEGETKITFPKVEEGDRVAKFDKLSKGSVKLDTPMDISDMENLHLSVYRKSGDGSIEVAFRSEGQTAFTATKTQPEVATGSWTYVNIPVAELTKAGIDITKVEGLQLTGNGLVYIDNVYAFKTDYFEGLGEEGLISVDWEKAKEEESLPERNVTLIGVNLASACGGAKHGTLGTNYSYPTMEDLWYFKSKGVRLFRFPFAWERVQHEVGGELDMVLDVAKMKEIVAECERLGIYVMLDMHNYCRRLVNGTSYKLGQDESKLAIADFADVWRKLATEFKDYDNIFGYDIMNEPYGLTAGVWAQAAQAAVNAIREVDTKTPIVIEGESYAAAKSWPRTGGVLLDKITDPNDNIIWQAHCYFDADGSGLYTQGSYDLEVKTTTQHIDRIKPFVDWLKEKNQRGILGEFGVPRNDARWLTMLDETCKYLKDNGVNATYWVAGNGYANDHVSVQPLKDFTQERAQMRVLGNYFGVSETTAIENVENTVTVTGGTSGIYTISGQKLGNTTGYKGILIVNGKKIVKE